MRNLSDDQAQARGDDERTCDSRHSLASGRETFERDRNRDGNHGPHVRDPENEQDRGEACAAADAADAEPDSISPGCTGIERQRVLVPW